MVTELFRPSTQRPSVLYWSLTDFLHVQLYMIIDYRTFFYFGDFVTVTFAYMFFNLAHDMGFSTQMILSNLELSFNLNSFTKSSFFQYEKNYKLCQLVFFFNLKLDGFFPLMRRETQIYISYFHVKHIWLGILRPSSL